MRILIGIIIGVCTAIIILSFTSESTQEMEASILSSTKTTSMIIDFTKKNQPYNVKLWELSQNTLSPVFSDKYKKYRTLPVFKDAEILRDELKAGLEKAKKQEDSRKNLLSNAVKAASSIPEWLKVYKDVDIELELYSKSDWGRKIVELADTRRKALIAGSRIRFLKLPEDSEKIPFCPAITKAKIEVYDYNAYKQLTNFDLLQDLSITLHNNTTINTELISHFHNLTKLDIFNKYTFGTDVDKNKLKNLDFLKSLQNLRNLKLWLLKIDGEFPLLPHLETLSFHNSKTTNKNFLKQLPEMPLLKYLSTPKDQDLSSLTKLPENLRTLTIGNPKNLYDLNASKNLSRLTELNITNAKDLVNIEGLAELKALQKISFLNCNKLTDISPLINCNSLNTIYFPYCKSIEDFSPLVKIDKLTSLLLPTTVTDTDLENILRNKKNLRSLSLGNCDKLTTLKAILLLPKLNRLSIKGCKNLPKTAIDEIRKAKPEGLYIRIISRPDVNNNQNNPQKNTKEVEVF